jgi:DinB superfamily
VNERASKLVDYFDRICDRTMRVIACIPPEKIDWTYMPGKYTLADLVRHLGAIERWMFAENSQRRPSRYPGHGPEHTTRPSLTSAACTRSRWRSFAR